MTALFFWLIVTLISYQILIWVTRALDPLTSGIRAIRGGDYVFRIDTNTHDDLGEAAKEVNELAEELQRRDYETKKLQQEIFDLMKLEVKEERRKIMAKLIQTNRMTALGLLVSSAAHEVNTPNGAIKLAALQIGKTWKDTVPVLDQVAEEEGDFSLGGIEYSQVRKELPRAMEAIIRGSERIDEVIKDLRAYSLGERNDLWADVVLNQVVADALTIIRAHGNRNSIQIVCSLDQDIPAVHGNKYQLEQVVTNLILNAIQSIPSGRSGTVTISTSCDLKRPEVILSVRDDGEGISQEVMANLMEPFYTTRMDNGGSGLGLYISNFIISEHKGYLEVESEVEHGTVITVRIPI
jgi:signal transduction histidine kinase